MKKWGRGQIGGEAAPGRWFVIGKVAGLVVVSFAVLVVLLSFGMRTPLVLSKTVAPILSAQAEARQVDLRIGAMTGVGLTGIRLQDLEFARHGEEGLVHTRVDRVDVYPDLWASLSARRPVIRSVVVGDGEVFLSRRGRPGEEDGEEGQEGESGGGGGVEGWLSEEVEVRVGEFSIRLAGTDFVGSVDGFDLRFQPRGWEILALNGRVGLNGITAEVDLREGSIYADFSASALPELFAALPVGVQVAGLSVRGEMLSAIVNDRSLSDLAITLHGLEMGSEYPQVTLTLAVDESRLEAGDQGVGWSAESARINGGQGTYELSDMELRYRSDVSGFGFQAEVHDGQGGRVELEGQWHLPTALVGLNAWIHDFSWDGTMPWPTESGPPTKSALVNGSFHGDIDLVHGLIAVDGQFNLRDLVVELPFLAREEMVFDEVEVALPLTVHLRGGAVSLVGGEFRLGELAPLTVNGHVVDAGGSYAFRLAVSGEDIDAGTLSESLPDALLGAVAQTRMDGVFGLHATTAGHSAFPESLILEVGFSGDVTIVEDIRWEDMEVYRTGDMVFFDSEHHPGRPIVSGAWAAIADLPAHVPAAVLAAEDASFFEHDGLDWTGLRMAMVHNLQEGALVRGGSTISQQVAKNLFLTHDRTISRKLQEAFLTWRVETSLSKERILELYLNVAEWGPEVHGLYGATQYYFSKSPAEASVTEMVMLASILPSPLRFGGAIQAGYLPSSREDKMRRVLVNMRFVENLSWSDYFAAVAELDAGRIGPLHLQPCRDDDTAPEEMMSCDEIEVESRDGREMTFEEWEVAELATETGWVPLTH